MLWYILYEIIITKFHIKYAKYDTNNVYKLIFDMLHKYI